MEETNVVNTEEEKKDEGWVEVNPGIWKPERAEDAIEGVLIAKETKGSFDSMAYTLELKPGDFMIVWGCAVLDERMKCVNVGQRVRIVYKGKELNKRDQEVKIFKVLTQQ